MLYSQFNGVSVIPKLGGRVNHVIVTRAWGNFSMSMSPWRFWHSAERRPFAPHSLLAQTTFSN